MSGPGEPKVDTCGEEDADILASRLAEVIDEYRGRPGALIPVLHQAQAIYGYLPDVALRRISEGLAVPISEVIGVQSFYHFFSRHPRGRYNIVVCMGTACYVQGSKVVLESFRNELGIEVGERTEDGLFSLNVARCFGACALAPVIRIGETTHERMSPAKVARVIRSYRDKGVAGDEPDDTDGKG